MHDYESRKMIFAGCLHNHLVSFEKILASRDEKRRKLPGKAIE